MENGFNPLECNDNDVLSLGNNELFKISQFKDKLSEELKSIGREWTQVLQERRDRESGAFKGYVVVDYSRISINGLGAKSGDLGDITIKWILPTPEGQDCELLRLGSTKWQKGKLRVKASVEMFPNEKDQTKKYITNFIIEFSPDTPEITTPESPLDDLRQMISQETQSQP